MQQGLGASAAADRAFAATPSSPQAVSPVPASIPLRVLSLFAGIGGIDLGLERTGGFKTVAFCEIDQRARRVLAKHWPGVPCYDDVCSLTKERLSADGVAVDVIVGGFPCQDISFAGRGGGLEGKRSGLWSEFARLIGELGPSHVIVENVSALLHRGLDAVLGTLASLGYDAEWHSLPASALGAPHHRDRLWIIADRRQVGRDGASRYSLGEHAVYDRRQWPTAPYRSWRDVVDWLKSDGASHLWQTADGSTSRVDDGLPRGLDCPAIGECGNAVVPQIPELIGRAILAQGIPTRKGGDGDNSAPFMGSPVAESDAPKGNRR